MKLKALSVKIGALRLSLEEATIPPYVTVGALIVVAIVILSKAV